IRVRDAGAAFQSSAHDFFFEPRSALARPGLSDDVRGFSLRFKSDSAAVLSFHHGSEPRRSTFAMRGRIEILNAGNAEGVIQADNGDRISFEFSAVLAYDVARLEVGRWVSFNLEGSDGSSVVNVCLHRLQPAPQGAARGVASLRYVGFKQAGRIRSYKFERTTPEEEMKTVIVTTDVALFARH